MARTESADANERDRLGSALRELLDVVVQCDADEPLLAEATATVSTLRERLAATGTAREFPLELSSIRRDLSLVGGSAHPFGPQIRYRASEEGSVGTVTLGPVFEGGPGLVHGGILALLMDHAMGHAAVTDGHAAMTTELTLRYRRPTPLNRLLRVRARLDSVSGRRLALTGDISVDGEVTVEARGAFLTLTDENVSSIFGIA